MIVDDTRFTTEQLENLSIGGCLFPTSRNFPPGTLCKVVISLDGSTESPKVDISGNIVHSDPDRVGIQFTGIDPDSLLHLHNILRYNASDPDQIEQEINEHPGLV